MDCSPPDCYLHGISQARIYSGLPFPSPVDLSHPGTERHPLPLEPLGKPSSYYYRKKELPGSYWSNSGYDLWVRKIHWRRSWQPTSVFLPGESPGQNSLIGYSPYGHKTVGHWNDLARTYTQKPDFPTLKSTPIHDHL